MCKRLTSGVTQVLVALAVAGSTGILFAANSHVYAIVAGNIEVYDAANNGGLTYEHTFVPATPVNELVITPDGRFLYTIADSITQYVLDDDGLLHQQGAPLLVANRRRGLHSAVMHPGGRYLFVMDILSIVVFSLSIDSQDGHLTLVDSRNTGVESGALALDPDGDLLFASRIGGAGCGPGGGVTTFQIGPGGSLTAIAGWNNPVGQTPVMTAPSRSLSADSRFVYVFGLGFCNSLDPPGTFGLLRIGENGSLTLVKVYPWLANGKKIGRFLVLARGMNMFVYTVDLQGNLTQTDSAPIEIPIGGLQGQPPMTGDRNGDHLFVATNDGIATYKLTGNGRITRLSKVMVLNVVGLTFTFR